MPKTISVWEIKPDQPPVPLPIQADTLDGLSRRLPQGFYSTFRTFGERMRALDLRHHLDRLYHPAAALAISPVVDEYGLRRALAGLLEAFAAPEVRVRLSLSTEPRQPGGVFVAIEPLKPLADEVYRQGVRVITSHQERATPLLKSTAFIAASEQARKELSAAGAFEALMLHNSRILEGLTSNFYYVKQEVLGTAGRGILPGVTRRLVLRLARAKGLSLVYRALALDQLATIDEAFITSSSRGIVPVVRIDDLPVGQGLPGSITRQLIARYDAYVKQHTDLIAP
jgi:branched-chain amino acid aminotransferase